MLSEESPTSNRPLLGLRGERDALLARRQVLLTALIHRDPHAPEARVRATTEALTEIQARLAELGDLEGPGEP